MRLAPDAEILCSGFPELLLAADFQFSGRGVGRFFTRGGSGFAMHGRSNFLTIMHSPS